MSAKNKDGQWYRVQRATVEDQITTMGEVDGETAILRASIYNKRGEPILLVIEVPMADIPFKTLEQFRQVLTLQNVCPILFIPPQLRAMELVPMSDVEVRRMRTEAERRAKEAAEQKAPEPSRIVQP